MPLTKAQDHKALVDRWRRVLRKTKMDFPRALIHFGLLCDPPFFGGSFIDWQTPNGRIHISPYVWGVPMSESPGFEFKRQGAIEHPVVSTYITGLNSLYGSTKNSL